MSLRSRDEQPKFRPFVALVALTLLSPTMAPTMASADTFRARTRVNLCPEYRFGGVTYSIGFRVGDGTQEFTPNVVSEQVNSSTNQLTVEFDLPDNYATTQLRVFARCANRFGAGAPSAPGAVTYCDHLALLDSDSDGLRNSVEDSNCDKAYDLGDHSNPRNIDSDGDGLLDNLEAVLGFQPGSAASSPKPYILKGGPADFDGDGNSNPVVYRPAGGMWFIRDFAAAANTLAIQYGLYATDLPFTFNAPGAFTNIGILRMEPGSSSMVWYFHSPGFLKADNTRIETLAFGSFGDIPLPGAWQTAGRTNPAVARLTDSGWQFLIYRFNGTVASSLFGNIGDLLKPADYDGDGLMDMGVFRPSENRVYFKRSSDSVVTSVNAGSGSYHYLVEGDSSGDGKADITFWEPINGNFHVASSDTAFVSSSDAQLGLIGVHVPLSYFHRGGKDLLTVVDHNRGNRYFRADNNLAAPIETLQWGLAGDFQG